MSHKVFKVIYYAFQPAVDMSEIHNYFVFMPHFTFMPLIAVNDFSYYVLSDRLQTFY